MNREPFSKQATAVIINGKVQGDWEYPHDENDEEGRGEIQRCDECKVFGTDEYAQKIYDQECKDYFNKEKV